MDNCTTHIFYHSRDALAKQIVNLVKIVGEENLIRMTGGKDRVVKFCFVSARNRRGEPLTAAGKWNGPAHSPSASLTPAAAGTGMTASLSPRSRGAAPWNYMACDLPAGRDGRTDPICSDSVCRSENKQHGAG